MARDNKNEILLSVENVCVNYGSIKAVREVNLKVPAGKIVTLIGANGAGKTSTLGAISGMLKPSSGKITFNGRNITGKSSDQINKMGLALVPEGRRIFPGLTVKENLLMGAYNRRDRDGVNSDMEWIFQLFPRLKERLSQQGGTLSGGEQQMLAISRGLMSRPKLIMMDEPSLGLAPLLVKEVFDVIRKINEEDEATILLVEQNASTALKNSDYGYVLETGKVSTEGISEELLSNSDVKSAYLGM